eukprot:scaffold1397_cov254-Pinguiococcus_pyrenoidosus.AAC.18
MSRGRNGCIAPKPRRYLSTTFALRASKLQLHLLYLHRRVGIVASTSAGEKFSADFGGDEVVRLGPHEHLCPPK